MSFYCLILGDWVRLQSWYLVIGYNYPRNGWRETTSCRYSPNEGLYISLVARSP